MNRKTGFPLARALAYAFARIDWEAVKARSSGQGASALAPIN